MRGRTRRKLAGPRSLLETTTASPILPVSFAGKLFERFPRGAAAGDPSGLFVTRAVTSRCFRLYCSGYLRSSSQAGRGPRRRPRDFDDLLKRHFLIVPVACRPSRLPRLNGRLVGRVLDLLEVMGAKISLGSF